MSSLWNSSPSQLQYAFTTTKMNNAFWSQFCNLHSEQNITQLKSNSDHYDADGIGTNIQTLNHKVIQYVPNDAELAVIHKTMSIKIYINVPNSCK